MKIETISCNQCGGPLKVPDSVQFVTCNHCDTQLAIQREGNVTFTEQMEGISERTGTLETELRQLTIDNQLVAHDLWWNEERKKYLVSTNSRGMQEPMKDRGMLGAAIVVVVGLVLCVPLIALISSQNNKVDNNHGYKSPEYFSSLTPFYKKTDADIKKNKEDWKEYHKKVNAYRKKKREQRGNSHIWSGLILFVVFAAVIGMAAATVFSTMDETYQDYQKAYQAYLEKRKLIDAGDELPDSLKEAEG